MESRLIGPYMVIRGGGNMVRYRVAFRAVLGEEAYKAIGALLPGRTASLFYPLLNRATVSLCDLIGRGIEAYLSIHIWY